MLAEQHFLAECVHDWEVYALSLGPLRASESTILWVKGDESWRSGRQEGSGNATWYKGRKERNGLKVNIFIHDYSLFFTNTNKITICWQMGTKYHGFTLRLCTRSKEISHSPRNGGKDHARRWGSAWNATRVRKTTERIFLYLSAC